MNSLRILDLPTSSLSSHRVAIGSLPTADRPVVPSHTSRSCQKSVLKVKPRNQLKSVCNRELVDCPKEKPSSFSRAVSGVLASSLAAALTLSPAQDAHAFFENFFPEQSIDVERCQTNACREMLLQLKARKEALDNGLPPPDTSLSREERQALRSRRAAEARAEVAEFAEKKAEFARKEFAYVAKQRAEEAEAQQCRAEGLPREEALPRIKAAGERAFQMQLDSQDMFASEEQEFEDRQAAKRAAAAERNKEQAAALAEKQAERKLAEQIESQGDSFCKNAICA